MISSLWAWALAVWLAGTAVGIVVFWVTWFRTTHDEPWLPDGYVEHERVFVYPDSLLAALLAATAVLVVVDHDLWPRIGLLAAGMLTFLGVIDAAYFARHGLFSRERGGVGNALLVVNVLALAGVLVVVGVL